jgi:ABC-type dipeptide/oligopeptide/nickel transport system permease component
MVVWQHVLRAAAPPVLTLVGLQVGSLLAGAVLTETVFAWPGVGRLLVQAVEQRDFPILRGCVLFIATVFCLVNLVVDLTVASLDPRVRLR